jgi:hypothetical protein
MFHKLVLLFLIACIGVHAQDTVILGKTATSPTSTTEDIKENLVRYNYHFSTVNLHCSKSTTGSEYDFCHYASEVEYLLNAFTTEMDKRGFKNFLILESLYRLANLYLTREYMFEKRMNLTCNCG